ncbi:MAG TPA: hypothetical protein VG942_16860 [Hyphomonadaceae bacterium]|nr:hypothetical protein [Hyphomonadaceae bacterium]
MRTVILALAAALTACNQSPSSPPPETKTADASAAKAADQPAPPAAPATSSMQPAGTAGSSGIGYNVPDRGDGGFRLDYISLIGTWSFDRSCASEDGMVLSADGKATYEDWGEGMWAVDPQGRLVLILRQHTPGVPDKNLGERLVVELTPKSIAGDDLQGGVSQVRNDMPAHDVNAKRCP